VILVRVRDDDAEEVVALALDEAQVREHEVDAGKLLFAAETHAAVDEDPLAAPWRPEAVQRRVHADLAEAAEGHEHELVLAVRHEFSYAPRWADEGLSRPAK
jgi:hypothetical protein